MAQTATKCICVFYTRNADDNLAKASTHKCRLTRIAVSLSDTNAHTHTHTHRARTASLTDLLLCRELATNGAEPKTPKDRH